jgi:hypothetical protein
MAHLRVEPHPTQLSQSTYTEYTLIIRIGQYHGALQKRVAPWFSLGDYAPRGSFGGHKSKRYPLQSDPKVRDNCRVRSYEY